MGGWNGSINLDASDLLTLAALVAAAVLAVVLWSLVRDRRQARHTADLAESLQQANEELQQIAYRDTLTGLPNRAHFEADLRHKSRDAEWKGRAWAVLFVDLDAFKPVNDSYGHGVGDGVLREVGRRLQTLMGPGVGAARIGGDSFLLSVDGGRDEAAALARQVAACVQRAFDVGGRDLHLTCSIGIALHPEHGASSQMIGLANAAMFAAKRSGGAAHTFYEPTLMDTAAPERLGLLADLRHAIDRGELELVYQPKIDARSQQITAAEALLRWNHPSRGLISPAVFIPLAERYGLIGAIGQWVVEDACRQARAWRDAGLRMRVAINLSAPQLRHEELVDRLLAALARHGVRPSQFTCEVTESVAMSDTAAARRTFERLGAAGIHVSIDDFGTGYSSLAYLRQLPAEELKIDRSFVMDLEHSDDARAIVEAVVRLAHALGLKVVAEGVETEGQRDLLVDLGCDELQGYLFAKPMSARALTLWAKGDSPVHPPLEFRPSLFGETRPIEI